MTRLELAASTTPKCKSEICSRISGAAQCRKVPYFQGLCIVSFRCGS
nr:MAG TPA: hypothetical protein [Caudoviricetes sp.]